MNQAQFESRLAAAHEKMNQSQGSYNFKTGEEIWEGIGVNPLDMAFFDLSELYLEADHPQRRRIIDSMSNTPSLYEIWYFVRRVGKMIKTDSDHKWLEIGIAAAIIDGGRSDFRDLIVSLILLRFAAELSGIDTKPFFDRAVQDTDDPMAPILKNVRDHKQKDVRFTVRSFGDPEWISHSFESP